MASSILMSEVVDNKDRKFGEALIYVPVKVVAKDGCESWAMFTENEIMVAQERADKNKEDIPKSMWDSFFT